ncbi:MULTISPECIES: methyl-accepting chemotaxis protein [unclassified Rhizobium]|uniref:methyl-accepting chemotaxis protein n=1 Tax=unclassified Rhizobium TaxID=2613769 RepID=UPI0017867E62|nr:MULTISPECIES: methyl-accepting chemotaxis protein [unclassified Rhizobium]MBD8687624.1 HAMP domain-containing protein [Rhizobium sp. CFBP 13644]MBD8692078.1 HAMP domain-containing protein [Rhizobium sp. CFBP 13717]
MKAAPRKSSVAMKLLAVSAVAISLFLALTFAVVVYQVRHSATLITIEQAKADAKAISEAFNAKISLLSGGVASIAGTFEQAIQDKTITRADITATLPALVKKFDLVFGSWFLEADFGFDGARGPLADAASGTNSSGQFTPYWTRAGNALELVLPDQIDYSQPYFRLAASSGKPAVTEPYVEDTAGGLLMMSIAYPVAVEGVVRGVAGVDIGLGAIADSLKAYRPFGTGRVYLLSASGAWLTAPDAAMVMKPYGAEGLDIVQSVVKGAGPAVIENVQGEEGESVYRVVYPFELPGLNSRWFIVEDVPAAAISAIVNEQTKILVAGGLFILLAVVVSLFLAIRIFIQKPIGMLLREVARLSDGDYELVVEGCERADEIGALSKALEAFRHKLENGRTLEIVAERERREAELERGQTEAERAETVRTQKLVVESLEKGLLALSNGNLTYRISETFPGRYAELRTNFNSALESMHDTIASLNNTVTALTAGTNEISRSSDQLSRRTEQQAASLEETAAALNEIGQKLTESAAVAGLAAEKVNGASKDAEVSGTIVANAIGAMETIEESANKMSQIISVIDQIAFQTNLLALNAGVEAARAGEAGKGFAVVAMEVRELAQRSAHAAKEIKELISASSEQVRQGVDLVNDTGDALTRIVDQVRSINGLIQTISAASREQAAGLSEINTAVNQMDQMTQQNAAMVEETNAASAVLDDEAQNLRMMVDRFEIAEGSKSKQARAA